MSVNAPDTTEAAAPAADEPQGFLIRGVEYPYPLPFKLADCLLVTELCGCEWDDFEARAYGQNDGDPEAGTATPSNISKEQVFLGLIACAVAHQNPTWARRQVITFVQGVDEPEVSLYGFDDVEVATDSPPAEAPTTEPTTIGPTLEPAARASDE